MFFEVFAHESIGSLAYRWQQNLRIKEYFKNIKKAALKSVEGYVNRKINNVIISISSNIVRRNIFEERNGERIKRKTKEKRN